MDGFLTNSISPAHPSAQTATAASTPVVPANRRESRLLPARCQPKRMWREGDASKRKKVRGGRLPGLNPEQRTSTSAGKRAAHRAERSRKATRYLQAMNDPMTPEQFAAKMRDIFPPSNECDVTRAHAEADDLMVKLL